MKTATESRLIPRYFFSDFPQHTSLPTEHLAGSERINCMRMESALNATIALSLACGLLPPAASAASALVVGRIDDFEDGTTQGWSGGAHHDNIEGGGPAGDDDRYLQIRRPTPSQPFPFHLGTKNTTSWTGDYLRAGIRAIQMDVKTASIDFGPENLSLRIVLFGPGGAFSSTEPATVITEGGWQRIEFGLTRSDLFRVFASGSYVDPGLGIDNLTETLRNVEILLIRHDPPESPSLPGQHPEHIEATLGIDNVTAVIGPAPAYDAAWTFGSSSDQAYILDRFEPENVGLGDVGAGNPTLLLHLDKRYQVTLPEAAGHPLELIARGADPAQDDVLLSAAAGVATPFEGDPDIAWIDNGSGTVTFTVTEGLHQAMTASGKRPGYRCGVHTLSARGDFEICTAPIAGDLSGDCRVDLMDLALLAQEWLENNVLP